MQQGSGQPEVRECHPRYPEYVLERTSVRGDGVPVEPAATASESQRPAVVVADAARWCLLVAAGLVLTAVAVVAHLRLGTASAPFIGRYRIKLDAGTLVAPAVALSVLAAVRSRWHERVSWRWLLIGGYAASVAWALGLAFVDGGNGLASPVDGPDEYLPDVSAVHGDPIGFLSSFVGHATSADYTIATRQHPPGPVLLLWALRHIGFTRPATLGLTITLIGCATVPLVAMCVRSLCGQLAARRLVPVLALAPYTVWLAVSMDAVTMTLCAAAITCGVLAGERDRSSWWAVPSGLLLGVGALFSYSAGWLGITVLVLYFVRRRPKLIMIAGIAALLPLGLVRLAGFVWPDGLTAAQADFSLRVGPQRSWVLWIFLDLVVLVMACGPAIVAAGRKLRRSPGWPFLVGAVLAVGFALGSGLSRGEVERSWLPFYPWLLVPAIAPERVDGDRPAPTPILLVALGAAGAIIIEAVLQTAW